MIAGGRCRPCRRRCWRQIRGVDAALLGYVVASAVAEVFYWSSYHAMFASVGDAERRGAQIGLQQLLLAVAGVFGPAAGGLALAYGGPWLAFGAAGTVQLGGSRRSSAAPFGRWRASLRPARSMPRDAAPWCSSPTAGSSTAPAGPGALSSSRRSARASTHLAACLPSPRWAGALGGLAFGRALDAGGAAGRHGSTPSCSRRRLTAKSLCGG